jgi:hypothetical protein
MLYFSDRRHGRERLCEQILDDADVDWDTLLGQICVVPVSMYKLARYPSLCSDTPQSSQ